MFFASQVPVFQISPLTNTNNYNIQTIDAVPDLKCHGELSDRCVTLFIKYFNVSYVHYGCPVLTVQMSVT